MGSKENYSGKITDFQGQNSYKEATYRLGDQVITIVFFGIRRFFPVRVLEVFTGDESEDGRRRGCVASRNLVASDIWGEFCCLLRQSAV
jgi:hypothetical protein